MSRMGPVTDTIYRYLTDLRAAATAAADGNELPLLELRSRYSEIFSEWLGKRAASMFSVAMQCKHPEAPPRLVGSEAGYNIVAYAGIYYAVPQSLGSMDFGQLDVSSLPKEILAARSHEDALRAIAKAVEQ
jgi:hypothetical protein